MIMLPPSPPDTRCIVHISPGVSLHTTYVVLHRSPVYKCTEVTFFLFKILNFYQYMYQHIPSDNDLKSILTFFSCYCLLLEH